MTNRKPAPAEMTDPLGIHAKEDAAERDHTRRIELVLVDREDRALIVMHGRTSLARSTLDGQLVQQLRVDMIALADKPIEELRHRRDTSAHRYMERLIITMDTVAPSLAIKDYLEANPPKPTKDRTP